MLSSSWMPSIVKPPVPLEVKPDPEGPASVLLVAPLPCAFSRPKLTAPVSSSNSLSQRSGLHSRVGGRRNGEMKVSPVKRGKGMRRIPQTKRRSEERSENGSERMEMRGRVM